MANIYSLQLLRNGSAYATKAAAITALQNATGLDSVNNKDGVAVLARYLYTSGTTKEIRTIVGYYADANKISGASDYNSKMTIIDVEGTSDDIKELEQEIKDILGNGVSSGNGHTVSDQLSALSGDSTTSTSGETSVEGAKRYADEKVRASLDALDYTLASNASKVVTSLNQTNGKISGTSANITSIKLSGYAVGADTSGKVATGDTLGQALGKLQGQINGMDKTASAEDGKVVTTVAETDGKVTETKANVKDLQLGGYAKTNDTGDIASADTINVALSKLENRTAAITISNDDKSINVTTAASGTNINVNIKSGEKVLAKAGNAGLYTDIKLSGITPSSTTVKEEYALIGTDGSQLGTSVKVYKDSSIVSITYITDPADAHYQNIEYKYIDASGNTKTEYVDISSLVLEAEFASGVTVTNHVAHGVVDSSSEKDGKTTPEAFLTVGANGFKISGIKNEITRQINLLDAVVTGGATAGTATSNHIKVSVGESNGKLSGITVTETNIANKSDLDTLSGKTFTVATSSNASITTATTAASDGTVSVDLITDASKIKMSGFTAAESGFTEIEQSSSITEAFKAVETYVIDNEETTAAALNDLNTRIDELSSGTSEDLEAEVAERRRIEGQNASAYTANSSSPYISAATSMNDADVKLAAALKSLSDETVNQVKVNNTALTETNNAVNIQVVASESAATNNNAIVITTGSDGKLTFALGTLDAGTY